ncbi:hypothetical protein MMC10_005724 [Thelotrema lepadinum]|nr:hypothetical protein [Thelotrema lepadinum]
MDNILALWPRWYAGLTIAFTIWVGYMIIYRYVFHPLAKFPGPKLAGITYWYEFYFDIILDGQYTYKLRELHKEYGPILRLNPDELHFDDPEFYDEVFNNSGKVDKPVKEAKIFGPFAATLSTAEHETHRIRRAALNPYFSKQSVQQLAPFMQKSVDKLCSRFEKTAETGESVNLAHIYSAFAGDVIREYCFSRSFDHISMPDYNSQATDDIYNFVEFSLLTYHIPSILSLMLLLPELLMRKISRPFATALDERVIAGEQVEAIRAEKDTSYEDSGHKTIFHSILNSNLPEAELSKDRLQDESASLVAGGTLTTAHFFGITTYHIAANPSIHQKLLSELKTVMPHPYFPVPLSTLQSLPYLTAIIHEGLRVTHGVAHRLGRRFRDKPLTYKTGSKTFTIPPNTTLSMTAVLIHENPSLFPDPMGFKPERWLGEEGKKLQHYLVAFSRGSRGCVGINLAWAEMYMGLAGVFRSVGFDVGGVVKERDVDVVRDCVIGAPSRGAKPLVVRVKAVEE